MNKMLNEAEIAKQYQEKFDNLMKSNPKIKDNNSNCLELKKDDLWRQAWADTPRRKYFPKFWFVRKQTGDVISVSRKIPRWLEKDDTNRDGRCKYTFSYWDEVKQKTDKKSIEIQNLNGLVHDSDVYDDAAPLLDALGPWAFGRNKGMVNGHHRDGNKFNNDADNIEFVLQGSSHDLLTYQPPEDCTLDEFYKYTKKIHAVTGTVAPGKITVITADKNKEIFSAVMPPEDSDFMRSLRQALSKCVIIGREG